MSIKIVDKQTLSHVKYVKHLFKNLKNKRYTFWKSFYLLSKLNLITQSYYTAIELEKYIKGVVDKEIFRICGINCRSPFQLIFDLWRHLRSEPT